MRRAGIGTLAAALAIALAFAASALGSPTPSRSLERAATASSSPAALRAEARLRRIETRVLGRAHATEHARMRAGIRRERAIARRRARLGLPPKRRPAPRRAMALGDPSQVGRWSAPRGVPVVAVHAILLATGRLMLVQQDADGGVAYILDPDTGAGHRVDPPGNIWCGGQTFLADGRLLAIGGTLEHIGGDNYSGLNHLYVFDPVTETWTRQADMRHGRWYPTGMRMPDGRVLITSGWDESGTMTMNADVEVYTPTGPTGRVDLVGSRSMNFYPHWFVLPDGRALLAGPGRSDSAFLNLSTFAFTNNPILNASRNGYGSGVLLPGPPSGSSRVFLAGGGGTTTTETFDAANPSAGWRLAASLPQIRRNLNTVILPDGDLLAVGGNSEGQEGSPQREALMYSPASNTWTPMAEQAEQRAYHSTALLLPDGRVWSGGDNTNSGGGNTGDAYEIFEPPYLFRGPRPVIASAPPALAYGQSFNVGSSGAPPSRAVLMSLGATTHGNDMNQRHVELAVSALPGGIAAVAPPSANVAPPGHYMLFLLSADGVPSEAKIITVGTGGTPPPPPVNQPPVAAFTTSPASPVAGQPVTFTDASTDDGQVAGRAWDLDNDGQFDDGTGATATATFAAAGSYTVSLRVTDNGSPALSATTSRTVGVSATPPPPGNLVANPSFETNLSGWSGYQATVAREAQAGAPDGGFVARVTRSTGTSFTIDGGRNVASTAAVTYTASAWVRAASASSVGKPIQIKLRERNAAGTVIADVGSANVALSNTWQKLTVTRTAAAGDNLGVRLSQTSAVTGNAFFADGFSLTAGGSDPPPPPPPPVNQPPVAAFTTSPASPVAGQPVTFTDASTDDGQVAGRAWDLDNDGQFDDGTGATATATFAAAGSYTVSLRVTDNGSPALSATTSRTVGVSATPPPPPPPPGNLVANPSFETNLSGWSGFQATVAREAQAGAPDGGFVARVTRSTGTSFTIDGGRNVATTAATTYTASAWVRAASASSVGKPIQIKLRERNAAGTVIADVGSANVALSNTWQKLTVTRATAAGNNLGVRLSHASAVTGDAFFADGFVLTAG